MWIWVYRGIVALTSIGLIIYFDSQTEDAEMDAYCEARPQECDGNYPLGGNEGPPPEEDAVAVVFPAMRKFKAPRFLFTVLALFKQVHNCGCKKS